MGQLREAIEQWIRAEFEFRMGLQAFKPVPTRWLLEAEDKLRELVTGKKTLELASRLLGLKHIPWQPKDFSKPYELQEGELNCDQLKAGVYQPNQKTSQRVFLKPLPTRKPTASGNNLAFKPLPIPIQQRTRLKHADKPKGGGLGGGWEGLFDRLGDS